MLPVTLDHDGLSTALTLAPDPAPAPPPELAIAPVLRMLIACCAFNALSIIVVAAIVWRLVGLVKRLEDTVAALRVFEPIAAQFADAIEDHRPARIRLFAPRTETAPAAADRASNLRGRAQGL